MMVDITAMPMRELALLSRMAQISKAEVVVERRAGVVARFLPKGGARS